MAVAFDAFGICSPLASIALHACEKTIPIAKNHAKRLIIISLPVPHETCVAVFEDH
jgi:hypothetical protein